MKKSVGLVVMTEILNEKGEKEKAVVLTRRGKFNFEKMKKESFIGCCQVTTHGGVTDEEDFILGLKREIEEELGPDFGFVMQRRNLLELVHKTTTEKEVITFGTFLDFELIKKIRLAPESGGLDILPESEVNRIVFITDEMKTLYCPLDVRVMFADEIEAVIKAFEIIEK